MSFDFGAVMGNVVDGLMKSTEGINVIGEPVTAGNKIIIPAVVARIGFGAAGGSGVSDDDEGDATERGSGGGGGGGVMLTPVFLIVDDDGERLLTVPGAAQSACSVVESVKGTLDRVLPRKQCAEDGDEAEGDE